MFNALNVVVGAHLWIYAIYCNPIGAAACARQVAAGLLAAGGI